MLDRDDIAPGLAEPALHEVDEGSHEAVAEDEDPLFGDIAEKEKPDEALSLTNSEDTRISFIRNIA